jgi:ABC-type cobalamin/Fe3+-siderophores transport system ATPase subunit
MDLEHVAATSELLRRLAAAGATILLATHDLTLAAWLAADAWLLHGGTLAAHGLVADVMRPDTLRRVFAVDFDWAERANGERVLVPLVGVSPSPGTHQR